MSELKMGNLSNYNAHTFQQPLLYTQKTRQYWVNVLYVSIKSVYVYLIAGIQRQVMYSLKSFIFNLKLIQ